MTLAVLEVMGRLGPCHGGNGGGGVGPALAGQTADTIIMKLTTKTKDK